MTTTTTTFPTGSALPAVVPPLSDLPAAGAGIRRLFHYTSVWHLDLIERAGFLKTVESNLSVTRVNAGPAVVWLTDDPAPTVESCALLGAVTGPDGSAVDLPKNTTRFVVDLPEHDAVRWLEWSRSLGITKRWAARLEDGRKPETWWLTTRRIPAAEWVAIDRAA